MKLPINKILVGDAAEQLMKLPSKSVHCCVTSPPYFKQRDYGVDGQIGLEDSIDDYISNLMQVFSQVKRVLRDDGTLWVNMGEKIKNKKCLMIPSRVALMISKIMCLRTDIIWHKPNCMPESVTDRPTRCHEYIFLFTKPNKYYCDMEAIKEPASTKTNNRGANKTPKAMSVDSKGKHRSRQNSSFNPSVAARVLKRNKRTVWTIHNKPYKGAHFAVFPEELPELCISAGTSASGCCAQCGSQFNRIVSKKRYFESGSGRSGNMPKGKHGPKLQGGGETKDIRRGPIVETFTLGWAASCDCGVGDPKPCIVLDPFMGSGTTAAVAKRLGRKFIGVELNPEYVELAKRRINE